VKVETAADSDPIHGDPLGEFAVDSIFFLAAGGQRLAEFPVHRLIGRELIVQNGLELSINISMS
jgi:hypothetical protein